jgi:predicted DNA-binding protein YlxM (UPF0122 family)
MTAQSIDRPRIRQPRKTAKANTVLTLTTTTDATPREIAETCNLSREYVYACLRRYHIEPNTLETFKTLRPDILAGIQSNIASYLTPDKLKDASVNNLAYAMQQLNNMERLERGQSTSNQGVMIDITDRLAIALKRGKAVDKGVDNQCVAISSTNNTSESK